MGDYFRRYVDVVIEFTTVEHLDWRYCESGVVLDNLPGKHSHNTWQVVTCRQDGTSIPLMDLRHLALRFLVSNELLSPRQQ
jgi:hypothetical protein